ncbi:hypothetical protein SAMN05660831_00074 [Thiohalospira halophila DSM 15071]|uniref:Uncharacterized protein n=1 Tax=Thiohalospira halophila DSM 15071 TaxID=1123397 RepID=A0A1I1N228_9GAMM|nr:hypothetical protein [Thiohalospira halophila]SFC91724.1 hypothetical protein SAMN05660831_00074 [Thiohalospira halophila DSM 15071]
MSEVTMSDHERLTRLGWAQQAINKYDWHCLVVNALALLVTGGAFLLPMLGHTPDSLAGESAETASTLGAVVILFILWIISGYYQHLKNLYVERYNALESGHANDVTMKVKPSVATAIGSAIWQPPVSWLFYGMILGVALRTFF